MKDKLTSKRTKVYFISKMLSYRLKCPLTLFDCSISQNPLKESISALDLLDIDINHCVKSVRIQSYSVRMRENADQNNSESGHFLRSELRRENLLNERSSH